MNSKILALVTESEATKNDLCLQLRSLLEGYMQVVGYATESGIDGLVVADLVVFSSMEMYEIARDVVDPSCPVVIANRSLNMSQIDQLFNIPDGTDVLVVNDLLNNAYEVIKLLTEVGVDHLNYHAYAPGSHYDMEIKYAVTPAEVALIPKTIPNCIDLGARIIDITTIIEILGRLDLLDAKAHFISARYVETIVRLNKRLYDSISEATVYNRHLNKVLNHINDGIISYDENGTVTLFNETCETIFGMRSSFAIGKKIHQIVRDHTIREFLSTVKGSDEMVGKIGENQYIIGRMAVDKTHSFVCTFKDARNSLDIEKKLRQMMMKKGLVAKYHLSDIIGSSPQMRSTVETAKKLASTDHSILIRGESGVGKEIFASAIHNASQRLNGPFLAINFSALPEELAESELFGYEEGAFTGARKGGKKGLFEEAEGGTIFLDEIGDISPRLQARLLRVLQEKEIRRIGGAEIIPVNVRVIAATHRDLVKMCQMGQFREDLYHRLRKLYIKIPPLRDHIEDIDELIAHFKRINGSERLVFSHEVMNTLRSSPWSGNIRELQNLMDYFQAVCVQDKVGLRDLPDDFFEMQRPLQFENIESLATEKVFEAISLEERATLEAIQFFNQQGVGVGREAVARHMLKQFPRMTPHRVRFLSDQLAVKGLIVKSQGRSGMHLTEKGMALIS